MLAAGQRSGARRAPGQTNAVDPPLALVMVGAAHTRLDLVTLAAAVVVLAAIGALLTFALARLERRLLFWQHAD